MERSDRTKTFDYGSQPSDLPLMMAEGNCRQSEVALQKSRSFDRRSVTDSTASALDIDQMLSTADPEICGQALNLITYDKEQGKFSKTNFQVLL